MKVKNRVLNTRRKQKRLLNKYIKKEEVKNIDKCRI